MRIAGIQHDIVWEAPEANFERLAPQIRAAAGAGARLVVLTEMFSTGFSMATSRTGEPVDGPSTRFLLEQAAANDVWVAASLPARPEGQDRPFNRLVLAAPDGTSAFYDKIHPFTHAGEHEHFAAGERIVTVEVEGLRVTLFVCYDLRFADEFWAAAPDTDCYLVPANWPETRRAHWQHLLVARAIENQAYVVGVNRVGVGGGAEPRDSDEAGGHDVGGEHARRPRTGGGGGGKPGYAGDSRIVDPMGEVLAAGAHVETMLLADVDAAVVADTRERLAFMPDRR